MPHFGLMDQKNLSPEAAALLRARLHIRCGRRRLLEGKAISGLVTLYDALSHGLHYYFEKHGQLVGIGADDGELHKSELAMARQLVKSEILVDLDFVSRFCSLTDQALDGNVPDLNPGAFLGSFDELMTRLGVMPFSEDELPPEDPGTF